MKTNPLQIIEDQLSQKILDCGKYSLEKITRKFHSCIKINSMRTCNMNQFNQAIYLLNKEKFNEYRDRVTYLNDENHYELCDGTNYVFTHRSHIFYVNCHHEKIKNGDIQVCMELRIYGKHHRKIQQRVIHKMQELQRINGIVVKMLNRECTADYLYEDSLLTPIPLDNIIMHDKDKKKLMDGINFWKENEEWYTKHHLHYKLGILLHGESGCGKTSLVTAISHYFNNAPILYMPDVDNYEIRQISYIRATSKGILIVLLEDIDMLLYGSNREYLNTCKDEKIKYGMVEKTNERQRKLFQLLDGIYSVNNVIYIATTNYVDRLDSGLIRPGRFDIQLEIPLFDEELALKMCQKFGYGKELLDYLAIEYPIQPSKLQSMIMGIKAESYQKKGETTT